MGWGNRDNRYKRGWVPLQGVYGIGEDDGSYNIGQTTDFEARYRKAERKRLLFFIPVANRKHLPAVEEAVMRSIEEDGGKLSKPMKRGRHSKISGL